MLKTIVLILLVVLTAVNLVLLWQVCRKMKENRNQKTEVSMDYIMPRLTAFGVNMVIIALIGLGRILLQIFH